MKPEIEVKFIDIDIEDVRTRLTAAGAVCASPMRMMRRVLVETAQMADDDAFLRLRDEGDKVTLTYKPVSYTHLDVYKRQVYHRCDDKHYSFE